MKTKITFELNSPTEVKVLCNGKKAGYVWSEQKGGSLPYPHDEHEPTKESIQVCGFTESSKIWPCGIIHGTKDVVLRFNPMDGEFYEKQKMEYKRYVDACFKIGQPKQIKSFDDWCFHLGHPNAYDMRTDIAVEDL